VISGHYILRDRWRNLRDRFGPSKHLKKTLILCYCIDMGGTCRNKESYAKPSCIVD